MAYGLIALYVWHKKVNYTSWCHVENYLKDMHCAASVRGDFPKLRFRGLIDSKSDEGPDRRLDGVGFYRITDKGMWFVEGKMKVFSHAIIYNNKCAGFSDKEITIKDALKTQKNIEVRGFGTFKIRQRKTRMARNPRTGAPVEVSARPVPVFKPSKELRAMVSDVDVSELADA